MKRHSAVPDSLHNSTARILTLSFSHFISDMMGGILPGILPIVIAYFKLNIGLGVVILSCTHIGSNLMQIPVARIDRMQRSPRMLYIGLCMVSSIFLLICFPPNTPFFVLCILMAVVGVGVAIMHPLGLRGVQRIGDLPPTVTTPAFMTGGFLGASMGPWLSALLVESFGMKGLLVLGLPILLLMLLIHYTNVKLARDSSGQVKPQESEKDESLHVPWTFASLFVISMFLNMGTTLIQLLIPSFLSGLKYSLKFGGMASMIFGIGSSIGSIMIGYLVRKRSAAPFIIGGFILGIPLTVLYFITAMHPWSLALLFSAGLMTSSLFPIFVSLAKNAESKLALSTKMGLIVGGTWGIAGLVMLPIGQIANRFGLTRTMLASCVFYFLAFLVAALTLKRKHGKTA